LKGYRSQRSLEKDVKLNSRVKSLCGFGENVPSHSTIVRFERRVGFERLQKLVTHTTKDLINCNFIKGTKIVLDSKPLNARCRKRSEKPVERMVR
jgi:transposase